MSQTGICKACILVNVSPSLLSVDPQRQSPHVAGCKGLCRGEESAPEGVGQNQSLSVFLALLHAELPAMLEESPAGVGSATGELKGDSPGRPFTR